MSKVTKLRAIAAPKAKGPTKNYFRTVIDAQSASAGPPLGPLLGKFGINIGSFCKDFNELTKRYKPGIPLPVTVNIKPDRTYTIGIHTPNMEYYLMQAAGIRRAKCEGGNVEISTHKFKNTSNIFYRETFFFFNQLPFFSVSLPK